MLLISDRFCNIANISFQNVVNKTVAHLLDFVNGLGWIADYRVTT